MQQRRLRLGDILDDYCPRERRITNHVVVAMIEDQVKQTRCSTCDADHDYKQARIPPRRRKPGDADGELAGAADRPRPAELPPAPDEPLEFDAEPAASPLEAAAGPGDGDMTPEPEALELDDDGPVHRRLIRATLPRPEGQMPERKEPEFTIRQPGFRDGNKNGHRRGRRPMPGQGGGSQPTRFGGQGQGQGPRYGGGASPGQRQMGNRAGGQPGGQPGGPRGPGGPGGRGGGRKRGR